MHSLARMAPSLLFSVLVSRQQMEPEPGIGGSGLISDDGDRCSHSSPPTGSFPLPYLFPSFLLTQPPTFSLLSPHFSAGAAWLHCEHSHRRWPFALHCCHWARQRVLSVKSCFFAQDDQPAGRIHFWVKVCFKADKYHTYSWSLISTYHSIGLSISTLTSSIAISPILYPVLTQFCVHCTMATLLTPKKPLFKG